jgi:hypothetical protein
MGDPNDNESNHQTDGRDPLQGGKAPQRPDCGKADGRGQGRDGERDGAEAGR